MPVITLVGPDDTGTIFETPTTPSSSGYQVQCDPAGRNIEWWDWQTPDGVHFKLHNLGTVFTLTEQGAGFAPIEYVSERRAYQDGETITDFLIKPRVVQLLLRVIGRSRSDYWNRRAQLLDMMRPNRVLNAGAGNPPGAGILTYYTPNTDPSGRQVIRSLTCHLQKGLDFQPRSGDKWDEWSLQEMLQFYAENPLFYYPTQQGVTVIVTSDDSLVFPITFPITFSGITQNFTLQYNGTWREYPVIKITGPIVTPIITNVTTGDVIKLNYTVPLGHTVTIDLTQSGKPVTLDDGTKLNKFVDDVSELAVFHLEPSPGAPSGVNTMQVSGTGTSSHSSIQILWYERYFGI